MKPFLFFALLFCSACTLLAEEIKQVGLPQTETLISLPHDEQGNPVVTSLCPPRKFWAAHPDAPWNSFWSASKAAWVERYEYWASVEQADPKAPWNQPEPERNPTLYEEYWVPPVVVPLVKVPAPAPQPGQVAEPVVVWLEDRVERQWVFRAQTAKELSKAAMEAGYTVQPEGFVLSVQERDRTQFSQMLGLVREGLDLGIMTASTPQTIADKNGEVHTITTLRFRQIMVAYGGYCKALWDAAKASE